MSDLENWYNKIEALLLVTAYVQIITDTKTYLKNTTKIKMKECLINEETQKQIIKKRNLVGVCKFKTYINSQIENLLSPIVSSIELALQQLARYQALLLQPHIEGVRTYVQNTRILY